MPVLRIKAAAVIPAPAPVVYGLIADYRMGHPSILPPEYFEGLEVEEGGTGAGTRIRFVAKAFGVRAMSRARITEPEPGRVLVEKVEDRDITTTFTVEPQPDGKCRTTIATEYHATGLRGWIETFIVPGYMKKVYTAELQLIAKRAMAAAKPA